MSAVGRLAGLRILLLNWRDLSNPAAGGAEAYAEQIARRFVRCRCRRHVVHGAVPGCAAVRVGEWVPRGARRGAVGVYLAAARHLRKAPAAYDAVVDYQNGIPFFAPLFARASVPVVCLVHHVHQAQFDHVLPLAR